MDEIRTTSTSGGEKGNKLARFDLIPTSGLWELAELYGQGAIKYSERNWELGYEWSKSYAALQRHANLFWGGESYDLHKADCLSSCTTHTEKHHLASVMFHALALMEWEQTHPDFDDRVIKEQK